MILQSKNKQINKNKDLLKKDRTDCKQVFNKNSTETKIVYTQVFSIPYQVVACRLDFGCFRKLLTGQQYVQRPPGASPALFLFPVVSHLPHGFLNFVLSSLLSQPTTVRCIFTHRKKTLDPVISSRNICEHKGRV